MISPMRTERHPALVALAHQIRTQRKARGFSQEDFAATVGLDRSYYGGVERGERNITVLKLMRIAVALNVALSELLPNSEALVTLMDNSINDVVDDEE